MVAQVLRLARYECESLDVKWLATGTAQQAPKLTQ